MCGLLRGHGRPGRAGVGRAHQRSAGASPGGVPMSPERSGPLSRGPSRPFPGRLSGGRSRRRHRRPPQFSCSETAGAARSRPSRRAARHRARHRGRHRLFDFSSGYGRPPQIWGLSFFHMVGMVELSRAVSTGRAGRSRRRSSGGCGIVDDGDPQAVDDEMIHRVCRKLSTDNPQAGGGCPQCGAASPHGCPLFGNATHSLTASSERRHTKVPGWGVGNLGIPGDTAGENCPPPVGEVCRTFCSPQIPRVVHRLHAQARWTKNTR